FRFKPYELCWHPSHKENDIGVHGELFTSWAFLEAHQTLQESPLQPECNLLCRVVALMFWSDATQLTTFSNAKLWPLYIYFGNDSKYERCQPSANLCSHMAYFQLPDKFKDFVIMHSGNYASRSPFYTHCHRELFHAQWQVLLNDKFVKAYQHGIVLECADKCKCLFPRIFTYLADYPEKVLIVNIHNLSGCPCPQCLVPKDKIPMLVMEMDMVECQSLVCKDTPRWQAKVVATWKFIYEEQYVIDVAQVESLLKDESLVPTENAFSMRLFPLGFDFFLMLVVDLLHEFELGIWKAIFIHLLQILNCSKGHLLATLDQQ
ncbi:hypothetical protein PISMIDRAFT_75561, partial [Pisolithus microcarpus 441]